METQSTRKKIVIKIRPFGFPAPAGVALMDNIYLSAVYKKKKKKMSGNRNSLLLFRFDTFTPPPFSLSLSSIDSGPINILLSVCVCIEKVKITHYVKFQKIESILTQK